MADTTITISGSGNTSYDGSLGVVDVFVFNTTGPTRLSVVDSLLRQSSLGVLDIELDGSPNADTVIIQVTPVDDGATPALLDARGVGFTGGWSALQDRVVIRDTGFGDIIKGTSLSDRIESTGGEEDFDGAGGMDTLVLKWAFKPDDFDGLASGRIDGNAGTGVTFTGFERMDATFGGGDDSVQGLSGDDVLRGNGGEDWLAGGSGRDSLLGGEGHDFLAGGLGRDLLEAGQGKDEVDGRSSRDEIRLGGDNDLDTLVFGKVAHSTGVGRDLVKGFDAEAEDIVRLDLSGELATTFEGITVQSRSGGRLDSGSFDADIAAALDATLAASGLNQAILWNPSSGDLNQDGHRYLVIDMDNDGAYRAGEDLVIQFASLKGALSTADFGITAIG